MSDSSLEGPDSRSRDLQRMAAIMVGLAPGFLFPFAVALCFRPRQSDAALLAWSIMLTITTVVKFGVELNSISIFSRVVQRGERVSPARVQTYLRKMTRFAATATLIGYGILIPLYAARSQERGHFAWYALLLAPLPILTSWSSVESGILIARSRVTPTLLTQGLRTTVPLMATLLLWRERIVEPVLIAAVLGEAIRWRVLKRMNRAIEWPVRENDEPLPSTGVATQGVAMMVSQSSPLVDRTILAGAATGSITAYELSDKVYAVQEQIVTSLLLGRVAQQARVSESHGQTAARTLAFSQAKRLAVFALLTSALLAVLAIAALGSGVTPARWSEGLRWYLVISIGAPASVYCSTLSRYLVISGRQSTVLRLTFVSVCLNAVFDLSLFPLLGGIGIIIATVSARTGAAVVYFVAVRRMKPAPHPTDNEPTAMIPRQPHSPSEATMQESIT